MSTNSPSNSLDVYFPAGGNQLLWQAPSKSTDDRSRASLAAVLVVALFAAMLGPSTEAQLATDRCYQVSLSEPIEWLTSGVWNGDGATLLLVDSLADQVLEISQLGLVETARVLDASGSAHPLARPSLIRETGGHFYLHDQIPGAIYRLNSHLEIVSDPILISANEPLDLGDREAPYERRAVFGWTPMGKGFLAFADLEGADGWATAFLYFDEIGRQQVFRQIPTFSEVSDHYTRSNFAYLAALGDSGYILSLEDKLSIGEVRLGTEGIRRLANFPVEFTNRPKLEDTIRAEVRGAGRATAIFASYESATMAAGIYAWDDRLYLLAKHAMAANRETAWWLIEVDPKNEGREISRIRLPTAAAHLTIVPGNEFWALIEKGKVQGVGRWHAPFMDTSSMVLVPAHWLENQGLGSLDTGPKVACAHPPLLDFDP